MKFVHLSDLHIGKRVNEFSMAEDQEYILGQILSVIDAEKPDGVLIAGDVYDKSVPATEAVTMFDEFLVGLSRRGVKTFVISGNHDSAERLAFGGRLMRSHGVYLAPAYAGRAESVVMRDEYGEAEVFLLPFVKPSHVKRYFPDEPIDSYTDALRVAVSTIPLDGTRRNILVTHQFVTGASRSESEEISVGGSDNVDASVFDAFDYVALGHIHRPQTIGRETLRYCGTPLKYSFSEAGQEKSVTVVELGSKGDVRVRTVPLKPLREMREIRGFFDELTSTAYYSALSRQDYYRITLTDEEDIPDAVTRLRAIYPNVMRLDYDNARTRAGIDFSAAEAVEKKTPLELFREFYVRQNGKAMDEEQEKYLAALMAEIWEGEK